MEFFQLEREEDKEGEKVEGRQRGRGGKKGERGEGRKGNLGNVEKVVLRGRTIASPGSYGTSHSFLSVLFPTPHPPPLTGAISSTKIPLAAVNGN